MILPNVTTSAEMLKNAREQLQVLNSVEFTDAEWQCFVKECLDTQVRE